MVLVFLLSTLLLHELLISFNIVYNLESVQELHMGWAAMVYVPTGTL